MKSLRLKLPVAVGLFLFSGLLLLAQSNSVGWSKVAGGGQTSTGGVFQVSGTIGQHDASSAMSGGNFSVTGGFWSYLDVVQTPGLPLLSIRFIAPNSAIVSWANTGSYTLQTNNNLTTTNWVAYGGSVSSNGGTNSVSVTPTVGNLFFRLR